MVGPVDPLTDVLRSVTPAKQHGVPRGLITVPAGKRLTVDTSEGLSTAIIVRGNATSSCGAALPVGSVLLCTEDTHIIPAIDALIYVGRYRVGLGLGQWLLGALPATTVYPVADDHPFWGAMNTEVKRSTPGGPAALPHLAFLFLVDSIRHWLANTESPPGWYAGLFDPVTAKVLRAMHQAPGRDWSLEDFTKIAGVVRSTLNEHFARTVGVSAKQYLISLRLDLAQTELITTTTTLANIAERLGYASPFSFSAAFKRHTGLSPAHFRTQNQ